jgi:hypothetical protein
MGAGSPGIRNCPVGGTPVAALILLIGLAWKYKLSVHTGVLDHLVELYVTLS